MYCIVYTYCICIQTYVYIYNTYMCVQIMDNTCSVHIMQICISPCISQVFQVFSAFLSKWLKMDGIPPNQ